MNNVNSLLRRKGVFHFKNFDNVEERFVPKGLTDHPILEGEVSLPTTIRDQSHMKRVISCRKAEENENNLKCALAKTILDGGEYAAFLHDPTIEVTINEDLDGCSLSLADDWKAWREAIKKDQKLSRQQKLSEANKLIANGNMSKATWAKVKSILQVKKRGKLWKANDPKELKEIADGFRSLYKDCGNNKKPLSTSGLATDLHKLLAIACEASNFLMDLPPLKVPYSRARDLNGFSQRGIAKIIESAELNAERAENEPFNSALSASSAFQFFEAWSRAARSAPFFPSAVSGKSRLLVRSGA